MRKTKGQVKERRTKKPQYLQNKIHTGSDRENSESTHVRKRFKIIRATAKPNSRNNRKDHGGDF